ncbi:MAG: TMEM165/GDT1 family protein [Candidatus Nanopelagicales bacterium]
MLQAFVLSFGIIFVAELGDKSQLMAMTFATRYRFWTVLAGITVATLLVHLVSVGIGRVLGDALPFAWINLLAGLAFIGFGLWTLRGDELTEADKQRSQRGGASALLAVGVAFFLAELGDKTMLATVTLATSYDWVGTWLGSTAGHGRRRCLGDRRGRTAGPGAAGEGREVRRRRAVLRLRRPAAGRGRSCAVMDAADADPAAAQ